MNSPARLYKYLPSRLAASVVAKGDLLFRNLSYFRKIEGIGRQDLLEGLHLDRPDNPVRIQTQDGRAWEGPAAFLNSIDQDRVFVFCLSTEHSDDLYREFEADACIEILEPEAFLSQVRRVVSRQRRFASSGLLDGRVVYYAPNRDLGLDPTDVKRIPFFKHEAYANQSEYRLAVALDRGLSLKRRIVNHLFSFEAELEASASAERHVLVGSIAGLTKIHFRPVVQRSSNNSLDRTPGLRPVAAQLMSR